MSKYKPGVPIFNRDGFTINNGCRRFETDLCGTECGHSYPDAMFKKCVRWTPENEAYVKLMGGARDE